VNQYRLKSLNYTAAGNDAFMSMLRKHGIDMELCVYTEFGIVRVDPNLSKAEDSFKRRSGIDVVISEESAAGQKVKVDSRVADWFALAHYTFLGKGSPEHCQIVLQLADHWKLAHDLQTYADDYLGLDCNGFVGNYLWHSKRTNGWTKLGLGNHDLGPDALISGFFDNKKLVESWEAIDSSKSYVMGMVDTSGNIIPGGKGLASAGHLVITEPNRREDRRRIDGSSSFALWVVESTAGHAPGLWESWYSSRSVKNKVFDIDREKIIPGSRYRSFKIAAVD
jgi:hypothetical protein